MPRSAAPASLKRLAPAPRFRAEIEEAEASGVSRDAMTLRLTLGDCTALKRDRELPVADISFAGGVMRYLGVKVEPGGVPESVLDLEA
ncbi:MAG: hypothetical protein JNK30_12250 [Phenylobacterium sp.]|uniref:hypothetical protein n=1 Tax=Phenylobacterium sp. TaxID=1871053 RepID=UPI001A4A4FFE|nr:hypothetical protein [Phenylobacterium sp.]MBL8772145.1 hypothetical protein [Phenylobacterium sp.]